MLASMYVGDTIIFIRPSKQDVTALAGILTKSGEVSGLSINIHKSIIIPIHC
jgi:hypothetical protein